MKNDINLLTSRKTVGKNDKKLTYVLFGILFAVTLIAGILLPNRARDEAELKLKKLENSLNKLTITEKIFTETTTTAAFAVNQRAQLEALYGSRSDILSYLSVIERSLPQTALLTSIKFSDNYASVSGIAPDDITIAVFCLKLRETNEFAGVFVSSSTLLPDESHSMFSLTITLHKSLSGGAVVEEGARGAQPENTDSSAANLSDSREDKQ